MMDFLTDYGLFLAQTITIVIAILLIIGALQSKQHQRDKETQINIKSINEYFSELEKNFNHTLLSKKELKELNKKKPKKTKSHDTKPRLFILDFKGDIQASAVEQLREEVTSIILTARDKDQVLLRLESRGGLVPHYGLASAQLARLKEKGLFLTISVDKFAASGGYMMASIANEIISAPFAIVGSIGVVAEMPNFNKWLKNHDIDIEHHHAGDYKRTLTVLGENTEEDRKRFLEELEETHTLFKSHIEYFRPQLDLTQVANGKYWYGHQALPLKLIDTLQTSDDFILSKREEYDIYHIESTVEKSLIEKLLKGKN